MMRLMFWICAGVLGAVAQAPEGGFWEAAWIAPGGSPYAFGVYHFRKTMVLGAKPARFVLHVSADNRFRLFVNGEFAVAGPAQSDLRNWRYETVDVAPFLKAGRNVLAAVVWNGGEFRPMAQISHRTGFVVQGATAVEKNANTDASWKVARDRAYQPVPYRDGDARLGWHYYVAGALERVDGNLYPWGWEQAGYDDSAWENARVLDRAAPAGVESHQKWQLVPSPVPRLQEKLAPAGRFVRASGIALPAAWPVHVPARTSAILLIDQGRLTTGYPVLRVSGGAGAEIAIAYTEALTDAKFRKGNRDETEGRTAAGVNDIFLPDGSAGREFRPLWVRSFRYVQLAIKAGAAPLTLDGFTHYETRYPAERAAVFESDNALLGKLWETGWRTMALGAQDTFVSDLSWERIQYVGDTQIHALAWLTSTGDDRLVRQALEQIDASRAPFGLTQSRFPADLEQFTPLYSLAWINMVHDYWMYRDDAPFVRRFLPGIEQVLEWYERQVNEEWMIGRLFHLDFVDSKYSPRRDEMIAEGSRSATVHTLYYAWALESAADLCGAGAEATRYRERAARLKKTVRERCYDAARGLFADTPARRLFSRHANVLAVLAGAVPPAEARALVERTMRDPSLLPLDVYFRFFLGRALKQTGLGDRYLEILGPWEEMMRSGLTTLAEETGDVRSDCHPWAASPNFEMLATVAGIEPGAPGFRTVRIAPALGPLSRVHVKFPHPKGMIEVTLERKGERGLAAEVVLPPGLEGEFVWGGERRSLGGSTRLTFSAGRETAR
jgi:alpha-L-rhamnosidase